MANSDTIREIKKTAETLRAKFTPPEYIPGCEVKSVANKDAYATENGWIEAVCGQHNQQQCRWRGQFADISVGDFVDVLYFASYGLFTVFGHGGVSGDYGLYADYIDFNTAWAGAMQEARLAWNTDDGTLEVGMPGGDVVGQILQEMLIRAKNETGSQIDNGTVVYISGGTGSQAIVSVADPDTFTGAIGIATENISDGQFGYVTTVGYVRDLNTSSFSAGDLLFLDEDGAITNVPKAPPKYNIFVGVCIRSHVDEGVIYATIQVLFTINDLSDVLATSPADQQSLAWDNANSYYALTRHLLSDLMNGSFQEAFDALVTSDGVTITMSLEKKGGGDLTMQFSDGVSTLDCTPAATIALTAGSVASPQANYIYIPQSTKVLTKSTTGWPTSAEHIKVSFFFVQTAAYVATDGALVNQNWNDALMGSDNQGHLLHMAENIRRRGALYTSGCAGNGTTGYLTITPGSPDTITIQITSGVIFQMHQHNYTAKDTSSGDDFHVVNDSTGAYSQDTDLANYLLDATGASMSGNYYNLVLWGVANKTGEYSPIMVNLPTGSYSLETNALNDIDGYDVYDMPAEFNIDSSTGFLLARITLKHSPSGGGTWTWIAETDLRGKTPTTVTGGGGVALTEFADNQFEVYNVTDNTKVVDLDVSGVTTATTRTLTVQDKDGTIATTDLDDVPVSKIYESDGGGPAVTVNAAGRALFNGEVDIGAARVYENNQQVEIQNALTAGEPHLELMKPTGAAAYPINLRLHQAARHYARIEARAQYLLATYGSSVWILDGVVGGNQQVNLIRHTLGSSVYYNADLSVPAATWTIVPVNTYYSNLTAMNGLVSGTGIQVPLDGWYIISGGIYWDVHSPPAAGMHERQTLLYSNVQGSLRLHSDRALLWEAGVWHNVALVSYLVANEQISLWGYSDEATTALTAPPESLCLDVVKI